MVYIELNKTNNVLTRFFDRARHCDSYFLWKLVDIENKDEFWFITPDVSPNPMSYNIFQITHNDTLALNQGGVDVPLNLRSGHYYYTVYETSEYSLNESKIIQEIENDILMVELVRDSNTTNSNSIYD